MATFSASSGTAATMLDLDEEGAPKDELLGVRVGAWVITQRLGVGGMGKVYAAKDPNSGAVVAIKVLHLDEHQLHSLPADSRLKVKEEAAARFLREAQVASEVGRNQTNIIQIFACDKLPDGRPYFVMEFLHGKSLADRLRGCSKSGHEATAG